MVNKDYTTSKKERQVPESNKKQNPRTPHYNLKIKINYIHIDGGQGKLKINTFYKKKVKIRYIKELTLLLENIYYISSQNKENR